MSRIEKLTMMEALWEDLSREPASFASPEWHGQALKEAERAVDDGSARFIPWEEAKQTLRNNKP
jgi:hypothetical protein